MSAPARWRLTLATTAGALLREAERKVAAGLPDAGIYSSRTLGTPAESRILFTSERSEEMLRARLAGLDLPCAWTLGNIDGERYVNRRRASAGAR